MTPIKEEIGREQSAIINQNSLILEKESNE